MELWRTTEETKRPEVFSRRTVTQAVAVHVGCFLVFFVCAVVRGLFENKEVVTPIDLTVIVNENLDGKENEPPPLQNPTPPEPPKPKPKPKPVEVKKPDPPKPLEQIVTNIVVKKEAKKEEKKAEKEKKEEEKKPEEPKKTKEQLRQERLERMRKSATVSNKKVKIEVPNAPSGDGKTEKQNMSEAEIRKLLNQGYKPGTSNQLATSEEQRCLSLVQMAINDMWDRLQPKIGNAGYVNLSVQFNSSGGLINVRLSKGCGDRMSDEAALSVARRVTSIRGLSPDFIAKFRKETLTIRYKVEAR